MITDNSVIQNLRDAGCGDEFIEHFAQIAEKENANANEQLNLLSEHRTKLLNKVHDNQKRIDCLDYLIYKIKKLPK